jgi:DNA processing protein
MPPHKSNFPQRNRIISGLSKAVVVVEAAKKSGALITADLALEEGRDVFAVPGGVDWTTSEGTNNLIRDGARLLKNTEDILEELGMTAKINRQQAITLTDSCEKALYNMLSDEPNDIDSIVNNISLEPKKIKTALLNLEIKGIIKQLPGKLYVRR